MFSLLRIPAAVAVLSGMASLSALAADEALDAVVVTATRVAQPISQVIGSVTVITREEIEQRQVQSLQDLLRGEAGFDITNSGGAGKDTSVFLRGSNSAETVVLVDGVRLSSATDGRAALQFLPVDEIERIEIVRGPRSSLYGADAIGGVIQIFTRKGTGLAASVGFGSHSTQDYSANFGWQGEQLRFNVSGSYLRTGGFNACAGSLTGGCYTVEPDNDGYHNASGSARIGYAFGSVADLEFSTLYATGRTYFDGYYNQGDFRQSTPSIKLKLTPSEALTVSVQAGRAVDDQNNFDANAVLLSRYKTTKDNASLLTEWKATDTHTVTAGVDHLKDVLDADTSYSTTQRTSNGLFAQYLGSLGTHNVAASLRSDHSSQYGTNTTGNLGWKWQILDRALLLNAGFGKAFHAPTFNDLYFPYGSNPNLKPERSTSIELGASGALQQVNWSVQAYTSDVDNLIALNSSYTPINTDARLRGVETSLSTDIDHAHLALQYTWQDPRSRQSGSNYNHVLQRRARSIARLNASYDLGPVTLGSVIQIAGARYDDLANTQRLGGYTTVDFTASWRIARQWSLQGKLGNALDKQYETSRYYNQDGRNWFLTVRYQGGR